MSVLADCIASSGCLYYCGINILWRNPFVPDTSMYIENDLYSSSLSTFPCHNTTDNIFYSFSAIVTEKFWIIKRFQKLSMLSINWCGPLLWHMLCLLVGVKHSFLSLLLLLMTKVSIALSTHMHVGAETLGMMKVGYMSNGR